ncbi:MAG: hypothetical protein KDA25_10160 [Phycisphaerales bacterium]|nr:hypothetical protein [Phycisphaerales bacterium]
MPATKSLRIDELMERASEALARTAYFEAERMCNKALGMARQLDDFERMARITLPLQEARRQRYQQALDAGSEVRIVDVPITDDMALSPGCYLIQPLQVGADGRRLRLLAHQRDVPVAVIVREPRTALGLCPIVAINPGTTYRTRVDPPDDETKPDLEWFVYAMEELGDATIESLDRTSEPYRRVDGLLERLDAIPEHELLHQVLAETCREAHAAHLEAEARPRGRQKSASS